VWMKNSWSSLTWIVNVSSFVSGSWRFITAATAKTTPVNTSPLCPACSLESCTRSTLRPEEPTPWSWWVASIYGTVRVYILQLWAYRGQDRKGWKYWDWFVFLFIFCSAKSTFDLNQNKNYLVCFDIIYTKDEFSDALCNQYKFQ